MYNICPKQQADGAFGSREKCWEVQQKHQAQRALMHKDLLISKSIKLLTQNTFKIKMLAGVKAVVD